MPSLRGKLKGVKYYFGTESVCSAIFVKKKNAGSGGAAVNLLAFVFPLPHPPPLPIS